MKESQIQAKILLALSNADCLVFRVDTAGAWVGRVVHRQQDLITLDKARMIQAGLCKGGSDIIGIHRPTGRFIAIEVKNKTGRVTKEQENFLNAIKSAGGIAGVARSAEEALSLIEENNNVS